MITRADAGNERADRPVTRAPLPAEPSNAVTEAEHPDLPLWPGNDLPGGRWLRRGDVLHEPSDGNPIWRLKRSPAEGGAVLPPIDWEEGLKKAQRAWKEHVSETQGSPDDMWAVVAEDLETIDRTSSVLDRPLPMNDPADTDTSSAAASGLVNGALQDAASADLRSSPEWQRIQTVRGAMGHLMTTIEGKAGEYWKELRTDARFQGFWKSLSIRTCEAIGRLAMAGADRIRRSTAGDLPSADALLKLSDSALTYSTVAARSPVPYGSREEATAGARSVAESFQAWIASPMGRTLARSSHPRIDAFREAWQQLPPSTLPDGPGRSASPYGRAAEEAGALAEAAAESTRFTGADLAALREVARAADSHAARLSVTLPGTRSQPDAPSKPAHPAAVAPLPRVAAPIRATGPSRSSRAAV
ncbi:hypothetical protein [Streptomyces sp. NBC_01012]|uniref:hypothetical protein n=1 Tax=Streptomyces sp. NBC_01012 TaxID=2903717 RepID=UPI002F908149|nr:hypothetical protein OG623_34890 [Streptomyces sp. NBC_01012]